MWNGATFKEEQIDTFRILEGSLYFPGHDPRNPSWAVRTTNRRDAGGAKWNAYESTSPGKDSWGIHVYDITSFGGELFSCGVYAGKSVDKGVTWTPVEGDSSGRQTVFFQVGGKLYMSGCGAGPSTSTYANATETGSSTPTTLTRISLYGSPSILEYDAAQGKFLNREDLNALSSEQTDTQYRIILPNLHAQGVFPGKLKIVRAVQVNNGNWAMYLGGFVSSDHQTATTDVFLAKSLVKGSVDITNCTPEGERPWDIISRDKIAYLLTSHKQAGTENTGIGEHFTLTVWQSKPDFSGWIPLFFCKDQTTFARSFEEHDGDFFLGLGTDDGQADPDIPAYKAFTSQFVSGGKTYTMTHEGSPAYPATPEALYSTDIKEGSGQILQVPKGSY